MERNDKMRFKKDQSGAIFIEAIVIIPLILILMLVVVFMINIFVVQSIVQYGLNQTVNELGNYTYFMEYLGIVDWSNSVNEKTAADREKLNKDISMISNAYTSVSKAIESSKSTVEEIKNIDYGNTDEIMNNINTIVTGVKETGGTISEAKDSVSSAWDMVKGYIDDPSALIQLLKSQLIAEGKNELHHLIGGLLGKIMLGKYVDSSFLEGCGVVSTNYNGKMQSSDYTSGIKGMDFSNSSFLGGDESRVIDIVVVYRIKFPCNLSFFSFGSDDDDPMYRNSLLIVQRAGGYGWINGDGSGKSTYNNKEIFEVEKTEDNKN